MNELEDHMKGSMKTQSLTKLVKVSIQLLKHSLASLLAMIGKLLLCLALMTSLSACLEIKQSISLSADGSGNMDLKIVVDKQWASMVVPELKKALQKDTTQRMELIEERDESGNSVIKITAVFKNVAELSDKDMRYAFVPDGGDFFRKNYRFEMRQLTTIRNELGTAMPFELRVKMPGTISETNGVKLSADEVIWNQTGIKKGTALIAKSSALAPAAMLVFGVIGVLVLLTVVFFIVRRPSVTRMPAQVTHTASEVFCTECGRANPSQTIFCTHCGHKMLEK